MTQVTIVKINPSIDIVSDITRVFGKPRIVICSAQGSVKGA
jgi:hypothetical protein